MKILVVIDKYKYSQYVLSEAIKLAMNTWADVTLLGVEFKKPEQLSNQITEIPITKKLIESRKKFYSSFPNKEDNPYLKNKWDYKFVKLNKKIWEEFCVGKSIKELRVKIRFGPLAKQVLEEAEKEQTDLIIIGCNKSQDCSWQDDFRAPQKIIMGAPCSVFLVKEVKRPNKIICCLEHKNISQESLELINQMVTLYNTELAIVGITGSNNPKADVSKTMKKILKYYQGQNIKAWASILDVSLLEQFISDSAEKGLIALWMGKQSILEKLFSQKKIEKLIKGARSSVLILR